MRVVFLDDVEGVARAGEIKEVADGFARNYLLPRKLAAAATATYIQRADKKARALALEEARLDAEARTIADTLAGAPLVFRARVGEQGRLYGSVTASDIADEVSKLAGRAIDHRAVHLGQPIKDIGEHEASVSLSRNVRATLTIDVQPIEEVEE